MHLTCRLTHQGWAPPQVASAVCTLLAAVIPSVPNAVLRTKSAPAVLKFVAVIDARRSEAPVVKPALTCLGQVLPKVTVQEWPAAIRPFNLVLRCERKPRASSSSRGRRAGVQCPARLCMHVHGGQRSVLTDRPPPTLCRSMTLEHRPKVRKTAQSAVVSALAALQSNLAQLASASEAIAKGACVHAWCLRRGMRRRSMIPGGFHPADTTQRSACHAGHSLAVCEQVLPGPEAAAQAAATAPSKKRQAAEEAIAAAVADALHLLGLLKDSLPLMSGVPRVLEIMVHLPPPADDDSLY